MVSQELHFPILSCKLISLAFTPAEQVGQTILIGC